ncbi:MAG: TIGR04283 family arsenosugar biosynthesis glycosyltransferase [Pseudomonadota bacterium]
MIPPQPWLSIIVPALNEAAQIGDTLQALQPLRAQGVEIIVVDGGSRDDTAALAESLADQVLRSDCGRARQLNAGAVHARGEVLLFLHADTRLPDDVLVAVRAATASDALTWGRFDVSITGRAFMLPVIAWFINQRSRWSGIATGDQALFFTRTLFYRIGKFPQQPLMEDVEISRRAKAVCPPQCLHLRVSTSGRRWESHGVWRTIWLMWKLRYLYWRGVPAAVLVRAYR